MTQAANHTPPASSAPAAPFAPSAPSALAAPEAAPAPGGPLWLVFCVMACSVFAALLGRLAHFPQSPSSNSPDSPDGLSADHPFPFLLHLVALDWFRRSRSAPATLDQLLRRSRLARAVLSQPLVPIQPCDLPGQAPAPGVFAPAFAGQLAAEASTSLSLTPTSFLSAYFASLSTLSRPALSSRNRALFDDDSMADAPASPIHSYSAIRNRQSAIVYSAFPRAPV